MKSEGRRLMMQLYMKTSQSDLFTEIISDKVVIKR
jgi:hypothetical protein